MSNGILELFYSLEQPTELYIRIYTYICLCIGINYQHSTHTAHHITIHDITRHDAHTAQKTTTTTKIVAVVVVVLNFRSSTREKIQQTTPPHTIIYIMNIYNLSTLFLFLITNYTR